MTNTKTVGTLRFAHPTAWVERSENPGSLSAPKAPGFRCRSIRATVATLIRKRAKEDRMTQKLPLAVVFVFALLAPVQAPAQAPAPNTTPGAATTANPELQRQLTPSSAAARRQKRADCNAQADQQKLHFGKRQRFVRQCMKK
jgi:hypothetical protein